jgi:hypothetical protein
MKRHLQQSTLSSSLHRSATRATLRFAASTALVTVLASACQGTENRDLGFTESGQNLATEPTEPFLSTVDDFAGRWVGQAEEPLAFGEDSSGRAIYGFPSGSARFALDVAKDLDQFGNPSIGGTLTFGEGAPPPPPTDASRGYPVGFAYLSALAYDANLLYVNDFVLSPFEGFAYEARATHAVISDDIQLPDGVLDLGYSVNQPLDPWCRLQTPFPRFFAPDEYSCVPDFGGGIQVRSQGTGALCDLSGPDDRSACSADASGEEAVTCGEPGPVLGQVDCDKLFMCEVGNYCYCDADSCSAAGAIDSGVEQHLLLRRVGDELVGVFQDTRFVNARNLRLPLGEIRFQRAE